jgi:hypothetical protein
VFQQVAHAEHDYRVADEEHSLSAVLARYHLRRAPEAEDDVAPAFSAWRAVVELSEESSKLCLLGMVCFDPCSCEAVEDSEFLFSQSLIDDECEAVAGQARGLRDDLRGMAGAQVRGCEDDVGLVVARELSEPAAEGFGLLDAEIGEGYVDVSDGEIDDVVSGLHGGFACDVSGGFAVANDVEEVGPDLLVFAHGMSVVKSCAGRVSSDFLDYAGGRTSTGVLIRGGRCGRGGQRRRPKTEGAGSGLVLSNARRLIRGQRI